jgi:hypothetical protein
MKTGSTSVDWLFKNRYHTQVLYHRHRMWIPYDYRNYFIIATVRNPYTREISRYHWVKVHSNENKDTLHRLAKRSFSQYLRLLPPTYSLYHNLQYHVVSGDPPNQTHNVPKRIDAILRLESLNEDYKKLPFAKPDTSMPTMNVTHKNFKRNLLYTDEDAAILYEKFNKDFTEYGYNKKPPQEVLALKLHL